MIKERREMKNNVKYCSTNPHFHQSKSTQSLVTDRSTIRETQKFKNNPTSTPSLPKSQETFERGNTMQHKNTKKIKGVPQQKVTRDTNVHLHIHEDYNAQNAHITQTKPYPTFILDNRSKPEPLIYAEAK